MTSRDFEEDMNMLESHFSNIEWNFYFLESGNDYF